MTIIMATCCDDPSQTVGSIYVKEISGHERNVQSWLAEGRVARISVTLMMIILD